MATEGDDNITITLTEGEKADLSRLILDTIAAHEADRPYRLRRIERMDCGSQDAALEGEEAADRVMARLAEVYAAMHRSEADGYDPDRQRWHGWLRESR